MKRPDLNSTIPESAHWMQLDSAIANDARLRFQSLPLDEIASQIRLLYSQLEGARQAYLARSIESNNSQSAKLQAEFKAWKAQRAANREQHEREKQIKAIPTKHAGFAQICKQWNLTPDELRSKAQADPEWLMKIIKGE